MSIWIAYGLITLVIAIIVWDTHNNRKKAHKEFLSGVMTKASVLITDFEAQQCYVWEDAVVSKHLMAAGWGDVLSVSSARRYIKILCTEMGYKVPSVEESDFDGLPITGMSINGDLILVRKETDMLIILHELAHMMLNQDGRPFEGHNGVFMETYLRLLERHGCYDLRDTLHAWALPTPVSAYHSRNK